jgi:hypothetical protein
MYGNKFLALAAIITDPLSELNMFCGNVNSTFREDNLSRLKPVIYSAFCWPLPPDWNHSIGALMGSMGRGKYEAWGKSAR